MKIILIIMAVLQGISALLGFFAMLGTNVLLAIIELALGLGGVVLYIVVINNMNGVEQLNDEVYYLRGKVARLEKGTEPEHTVSTTGPATPRPKETAHKPWTCPKCNSVNKAGTTACESCGARYSSWFES